MSFAFPLKAGSSLDTTALIKQNAKYRNRIQKCEIQAVPYFYSGNASFSGRASAAMLLSTILNPRVVTLREVNDIHTGMNDDPVLFEYKLFNHFKIDHFRWQGGDVKEWSVFKKGIEEEVALGHPVILHGVFSIQESRFEQINNKVLIFGFDKWGFIVHDPCGHWLGYDVRAYDKGPREEGVFMGRSNLMLFKSLEKLFNDGALMDWVSAWNHESKVVVVNDFLPPKH